MIRVTVELVSAIHPSRNRVLGVAIISNTGTGEGKKYDYNVKLSKWAPREDQTWKSGLFSADEYIEGFVERFDREKRGPWDLLYLALKNTILAWRN